MHWEEDIGVLCGLCGFVEGRQTEQKENSRANSLDWEGHKLGSQNMLRVEEPVYVAESCSPSHCYWSHQLQGCRIEGVADDAEVEAVDCHKDS